MSKPQLRIVKNESQNQADIYLYGIIGDYWYSEDPLTARAFQRELSFLSDYSVIHVHINSPGGDCFEGIAIANAIKASKKEIHTYNDGICASMAAVILCAAGTGKRHAAKGSLTMFHSASTYAWGNAEELRQEAEMLDKYDDVLAEIIGEALGKTLEETKALYFDGKDHWLTATEAEAAGVVTVENYESNDMPDNPSALKFNQVAAFYNQKINNKSDMSLLSFNNPFKGISALAKVAAKDVTDEQLATVHKELEAEGINGLTLVKTDDLTETVTNSEKVPGLEKKVNDLETAQKADQKTIADLNEEVKKLKAELNKPDEDPAAPVADKADEQPDKKDKVQNFETSVDIEAKKLFGIV